MAKAAFVKITSPLCRFGFAKVWRPEAMQDGQQKKYSVAMIFTPKTDLSKMKAAAHKAATDKFGKEYRKVRGFKWPFVDGNEFPDIEGYPGNIIVNARSKDKPGIIDRNKNVITEDEADGFYSGCYGHATMSVFAFDQDGGKGVAFCLFNLIKVKDGKKFSGRKSAEEDFADLEIEDDGSDDATNYEEPTDATEGDSSDDLLG
jgi:hypothetical protein